VVAHKPFATRSGQERKSFSTLRKDKANKEKGAGRTIRETEQKPFPNKTESGRRNIGVLSLCQVPVGVRVEWGGAHPE